jgi:hypothetical protein
MGEKVVAGCRQTNGSSIKVGRLEGEPQPELDLPGRAERIDACSYPNTVYVVPSGSYSIDLSRGSRQQIR